MADDGLLSENEPLCIKFQESHDTMAFGNGNDGILAKLQIENIPGKIHEDLLLDGMVGLWRAIGGPQRGLNGFEQREDFGGLEG